jgi:hypothetical protein
MGFIRLANLIATTVSETAPTLNQNSSLKLGIRDFTDRDANAYIYWSRPFPLKATIISAKLVWFTSAEPGTGTRGFKFTRLATGFTDSKVVYNNRPTNFIAGDKTVSAALPWADKKQWELDITDWMQSVSSGGVWAGIRIVPTVFEDNALWIYSEINPDLALWPYVEITWSDHPSTPQGLAPSGGRAVGVPKPVVRANYVDVGGNTTLNAVRVQINSTDVWTAPSYDSGWVLSAVPELDLSRGDIPLYGGIAVDTTVFWRIAFRDGAGLESVFSAATTMKYDTLGTLTLNNPPAGTPVQGLAVISHYQAAILASLFPQVGGVAPVWQSMTSTAGATAANTTVAYPASVATNDILLWQQYFEPSTATMSPPDGTWQKLVQVNGANGGFNVQWWWKRATGAHTGNVTFTHSSTWRNASMHRITGALASGNPWETVNALASLVAGTLTPDVSIAAGSDRLAVWGAVSDEGAGQTWTPPTGFTERLELSEQTLATKTGPLAAPILEDTTPPISWAFSGETQAAYQIQIYHVVNGVRVIDWDTGKQTSTITSLTVPSGKINEPTNTTYTLTLKVWDTKAREAVANSFAHVEVVRQFTFVPGPTTGTTGLVATPATDGRPKVTLTWGAATFPDRFNILANYGAGYKVIAAGLDPNETFQGGTTHSWVHKFPHPGRSITYQVQRVVNNVASSSNVISSTVKVNSYGIWVQDPTGTLELFIEGDSDRPFEFADIGTTLQSIAPDSAPVEINQTLGGLVGTIEGQLINYYNTAEVWRNNFFAIRNMRVKQFYLTSGDYTFKVVLDQFTYEQRTIPEKVYKVSFRFHQQDHVANPIAG